MIRSELRRLPIWPGVLVCTAFAAVYALTLQRQINGANHLQIDGCGRNADCARFVGHLASVWLSAVYHFGQSLCGVLEMARRAGGCGLCGLFPCIGRGDVGAACIA